MNAKEEIQMMKDLSKNSDLPYNALRPLQYIWSPYDALYGAQLYPLR